MRISKGAKIVAAVAGGVAARRVLARQHAPERNGHEREDASRWRVVTIYRKPDEVAPEGRLPEPLAQLGDAIEVQIREAPGDKGTELAARLRMPEPSGLTGTPARISGKDPRQAVRSALRESKQLVETGEVLKADTPPTTKPTIRGLPIDLAGRRAGGEGRL